MIDPKRAREFWIDPIENHPIEPTAPTWKNAYEIAWPNCIHVREVLNDGLCECPRFKSLHMYGSGCDRLFWKTLCDELYLALDDATNPKWGSSAPMKISDDAKQKYLNAKGEKL